MNTAVKLSAPKQLLTITQEMLTSAQAGKWEKLVDLERSRLPLLSQVFAQGVADNVELAQEILSIDEETRRLAQAEMPVIQDELLKMQNSGKASAAYQTIEGLTTQQK
jgi:hypothetical protein